MYNVLEKLISGKASVEEYAFVLSGNIDEELFTMATKIRREKYKNYVYVRGVIDISNYCVCNCKFCGNAVTSSINRYRMGQKEIISCIDNAVNAGVDIIHLASGTDLQIDYNFLEPIIDYCHTNDIGIELAIGIRDISIYEKLYNFGVKRFILKFETSNPRLFQHIKKCNHTFNEYIEFIEKIRDIGGEIGSGNIVGLPGQQILDIANDIEIIRNLKLSMISTSVFIPNEESIFKGEKSGDRDIALRLIALNNILNCDKKISIPTNSTLGVKNKIEAMKIGANVITVNFTHEECEYNYSIYGGANRYRAGIEETEQFIQNANMKRVTWKEFNRSVNEK